ncbi:MAG: hypothetical protein JRJ04_14535 [Deltaproteobacteria bacterium]|nr:hypothetical protein [Deltaproteobacteria bacterium]
MGEQQYTYTEDQIKKMTAIIGAILEKAATDENFRKLCLADASSAFKDVTGHELPEGANFQFVESGDTNVSEGIFKLPPLQAEELTDEDLEKVAGGMLKDFLPSFSLPSAGPIVSMYGLPLTWDKM